MLNAQSFGAGMNLQCTTDIVLFHRFTKQMEEQIIGRGQRLGRTDRLNILYLIHSNEDRCYIEPEKYQEIAYQEWLEMDQDTTKN
jgi:hypothetical protein